MTDAQLSGMSVYYEIYNEIRHLCPEPHETAKKLAVLQMDRILHLAADRTYWLEARRQIVTMP
jgi:hypothetical protein